MSHFIRIITVSKSEIVSEGVNKSMDKCLFQEKQISMMRGSAIICHHIFLFGTSEECGILSASISLILLNQHLTILLTRLTLMRPKPERKCRGCHPCHHASLFLRLPRVWRHTRMYGSYSRIVVLSSHVCHYIKSVALQNISDANDNKSNLLICG